VRVVLFSFEAPCWLAWLHLTASRSFSVHLYSSLAADGRAIFQDNPGRAAILTAIGEAL